MQVLGKKLDINKKSYFRLSPSFLYNLLFSFAYILPILTNCSANELLFSLSDNDLLAQLDLYEYNPSADTHEYPTDTPSVHAKQPKRLQPYPETFRTETTGAASERSVKRQCVHTAAASSILSEQGDYNSRQTAGATTVSQRFYFHDHMTGIHTHSINNEATGSDASSSSSSSANDATMVGIELNLMRF